VFSNRKTDTETNGKAGLTGRERRKGNSPPSLIGPDLTIHGELSTPGDLQIDGHIIGNIQCNNLTLGAAATVKGDTKANEVLVCGSLTGNIHATTVTLTKTAKIDGDIHHETIAIEAGAVLNGKLASLKHKGGSSGMSSTGSATTAPIGPRPTPPMSEAS
jgi:cytoskeletal protein CcmA (bactofilin family)